MSAEDRIRIITGSAGKQAYPGAAVREFCPDTVPSIHHPGGSGSLGVVSEWNIQMTGASQGKGKFDAAMESFAQVGGNRLPIARLWTAYTTQKAAAVASD